MIKLVMDKKKTDKKNNISNKKLKKLSYTEIILGNPLGDVIEIFLYIAVFLYGIFIGIKIFNDVTLSYTSNQLYWIINYALTGIHTLMVWKYSFKTIWAMPQSRINMFNWISLIFLFHSELAPWHFFYILPVTIIYVFLISHNIDMSFIKKNRLNPALLTKEVLAKQQGFYLYLIIHILFLTSIYFISNNFPI